MIMKSQKPSSLESPDDRKVQLARVRELVELVRQSKNEPELKKLREELYKLSFALCRVFAASKILKSGKIPEQEEDQVHELCHATAVNMCYMSSSMYDMYCNNNNDGAALYIIYLYTFKAWVKNNLIIVDKKVATSLNQKFFEDDPDSEEVIVKLRASYIHQGDVQLVEEEIVQCSGEIAKFLESRYGKGKKSRLVVRIALGVIAEDEFAKACMLLLPYHLRCRVRAIKLIVEKMLYSELSTGSRYL